MYSDLEGRIVTDVKGEYFEIRKRLKQGDPLSPPLFTCALEKIFMETNWEKKGILIDGEYLNNLRFANDAVVVAEDIQELKLMLNELNEIAKKAGLNMNMSKTKIMSKNLG